MTQTHCGTSSRFWSPKMPYGPVTLLRMGWYTLKYTMCTLGIGCIRLEHSGIRWHTLAYAGIRWHTLRQK